MPHGTRGVNYAWADSVTFGWSELSEDTETTLTVGGTTCQKVYKTTEGFRIAMVRTDGSITDGSRTTTINGVVYRTIKGSANRKNYIKVPDGYVATKLIIYNFVNGSNKTAYLSEVNGTTYTEDTTPLTFTVANANGAVGEKYEVACNNLTELSFTHGKNQSCFVVTIEYDKVAASPTTISTVSVGGKDAEIFDKTCSFAFEYGTTGPLAVTTDADASATVKISGSNAAKVDAPSTLTYSSELTIDVPAVNTSSYYYLEVTADGAETSYYEIVVSQLAEVTDYTWKPTGTSGAEYANRTIYNNRFVKATIVANGTLSLAANTSSEKSTFPYAFKIQGSGTLNAHVDDPYLETNASSKACIIVAEAKENGLLTAYVTYNTSSNKKNFRIWDNTDNKEVSNVEWDGSTEAKVQKAITIQALKNHTYIIYAAGTGAFLFAGLDYSYVATTEIANVKIGDVELSAADLATLKAENTVAVNDFISTTGAPVITAEGGVTFTNDGNNVYTATSWGETYTIDLSGCTFINGDALLSSCKYKVIDNKKTAITEPAAGFANENIAAIQVGTYGMTGQAPNVSTNLANTNTFKVGWNTTIGFTCTENDKIRAIKVTGVSASGEGKAHKFTLTSADENSEAVITTPTDNMLNGSTTVSDDVLFLVDEAGLGEQFNLKFDGWFESFVTFTVYYDEVQKATISAGGYTTFCPIYSDVTIPENVTAYTAKINDAKDAVVLTKVEGGKLPQGCGVVLAGAKSTEYTFVPTTDAADLASDNQMVGATEDVEIENVYVLGVKDGTCVFGKWDGTNGLFPAGKAYLNVTSTLAKTLRVVFDDDNEATGINNAATEKAQDGAIFNLAGQKVSANYKGIVIINGKKALVK